MRLAVYTDYTYHRVGRRDPRRSRLRALCRQARRALRAAGRARPARPGRRAARYPIGGQVDFVALPFYSSPGPPLRGAAGDARSVRTFRRALDDVDVVWLLGPHPLALVFARVARRRGKRVVLGVRQDSLEYMRSRHPGRPHFQRPGADSWRRRGAGSRGGCRWSPSGPTWHGGTRIPLAVLEIAVSLIEAADVVTPRARSGPRITVASCGPQRRAPGDGEEPAAARRRARRDSTATERRWRLDRLRRGAAGGRSSRAAWPSSASPTMPSCVGYVPFGEALSALYRASHALLHVSWTEGLPQVLLEAFAAGLPVVATDVGGIGEAVGDAALLVAPGDAARRGERTWPNSRGRTGTAPPDRGRSRLRRETYGRERDRQRRALP